MKKIIVLAFLVTVLSACSNTNTKEASDTTKIIEPSVLENTQKKELKKEVPNLLSVGIDEFKQNLSGDDFVLIDLRTNPELLETGVIPGAKQIDFYSSTFQDKISNLDKNQKYLIYCRSGNRSGKTLNIMKQLGFKNVIELRGGMNGWLSSGEKTSSFKQESEVLKKTADKTDIQDNMMKDDSDMMSSDNNMMPRTITLNATKWQFDQKIIKATKGEKLTIKVNNIDVLHGIAIPDMKLIGDNEIEVDTSKAGEYEFRCLNYCGEGHQGMTGKLIIE